MVSVFDCRCNISRTPNIVKWRCLLSAGGLFVTAGVATTALSTDAFTKGAHVCVCVCLCVRVRACVCVLQRMRACARVWLPACMHACVSGVRVRVGACSCAKACMRALVPDFRVRLCEETHPFNIQWILSPYVSSGNTQGYILILDTRGTNQRAIALGVKLLLKRLDILHVRAAFCGITQPFTAAPFALITRLQIVRTFAANRFATYWTFLERKSLLMRSGYMVLPSIGTLLDKSRRSMTRSCLPTQPHIFSTGLRPGERAGKSMNDMLGRCSVLNDLLVRRIFAPASQTAYFTMWIFG